MSSKKHLIVLSAPSGAGKTTVARHLLSTFPFLRFSVSATTRPKRAGEEHGKDYFFLTRDEFRHAIEQNDLIESEEIFGNYYGTLRSVVSEAVARGEFLVFDVSLAQPDEQKLILRITDEDNYQLYAESIFKKAYSKKFFIPSVEVKKVTFSLYSPKGELKKTFTVDYELKETLTVKEQANN